MTLKGGNKNKGSTEQAPVKKSGPNEWSRLEKEKKAEKKFHERPKRRTIGLRRHNVDLDSLSVLGSSSSNNLGGGKG